MNIRQGGAAILIAALLAGTEPRSVNAAGLEPAGTAPAHRSGHVTLYSLPGKNPGPWGIAVDVKNRVWVTLNKTSQLGRLDPATGRWHVLRLPGGARPFLMAKGKLGDLWVSDYDYGQKPERPGRLFRVTDTESGALQVWPVEGAAPGAFMWVEDALWFTDMSRGVAGAIASVPLAGQSAVALKPGALFPSPPGGKETGSGIFSYGIVQDRQGAVWYAEAGNGRLIRVTRYGHTKAFPLPDRFWSPSVLEVAPDGNLWVSAHAANLVAEVDSASGTVHRLLQIRKPAKSENASVSRPNDIVATRDSIWVTEHEGGRIARILPGHYTVIEYPLSVPKSLAQWMAPDPNGGVWFAAYGTGQLGRIDVSAPVFKAEIKLSAASVRKGGTVKGELTIESIGNVSGDFTMDLPDLPYGITGALEGDPRVRIEPGKPARADFTVTVTQEADIGPTLMLAGASSPEVLITQSATINVRGPLRGIPGIREWHLVAVILIAGMGVFLVRRRR